MFSFVTYIRINTLLTLFWTEVYKYQYKKVHDRWTYKKIADEQKSKTQSWIR